MNKKTQEILAMALIVLIVPTLALAATENPLSAQITTIENLITGGWMRGGMFAVSAGTFIMGIAREKLMTMVIGVGGVVAASLINDFIDTTYAIVL